MTASDGKLPYSKSNIMNFHKIPKKNFFSSYSSLPLHLFLVFKKGSIFDFDCGNHASLAGTF